MKTVVFDLDGTLVDSAPDLQAAANRLMRQNGLPELDLATIICFIGNGMARLVELCFARYGSLPADLPDQVARFKRFYSEEDHRRTRFMPGAELALRRLSAAGITLGLCTNKDEGVARTLLAKLQVGGLFAGFVGGDSGLPRKPDPAPLLACVERCRTFPREALYVGDSEIDAVAAEAAGIRFFLYRGGYHTVASARFSHLTRISNLAELPCLLVPILGSATQQLRTKSVPPASSG